MLRERLICGVNDVCIQQRLLAESQLEFKKALELATAMETADRNTRDLKHGNPNGKPKEPQVNRLTKEPPKQKQPPRQSKECYRCRGQFHNANKCRYKEECHRCRKTGHKANNSTVAVNVKGVFKTATSLETRIAWRHQKKQRKNAKNKRCFN